MDRPLSRSTGLAGPGLLRAAKGLVVACALLGTIAITWRVWHGTNTAASAEGLPARRGVLQIARNGLEVSSVREGTFEDYISLRGHVEPLRTVHLDTLEGGRVNRVLVEDGAFVKSGDLIVELVNPTLTLDVLSRQSQVSTQLTQIRTTELTFAQDQLTRSYEIAEIEFRLQRLRREQKKQRELARAGAIGGDELEATSEELHYQEQRFALAKQTQARREKLVEQQLDELRRGAQALAASAEAAQGSLSALEVRATVDGRITNLTVDPGASVPKGARIATIDVPGEYKLVSAVEEFYAGRVHLEQRGRIDVASNTYEVMVKQIDPLVKGGKFEVDFVFVDARPEQLKRGQSLDFRLYEGETTQEKVRLLKFGAFYQDSGGTYAFVVDRDGKSATRRAITLGRRNAREIQVLSGLDVGDQVVTSSYKGFDDIGRLELE